MPSLLPKRDKANNTPDRRNNENPHKLTVTPSADIINVKKQKHQNSSHNNISRNRNLEMLPLLNEDFAEDDIFDLLILKIRQCCVIFDFTKTSDEDSKKIKTMALEEICYYISNKSVPEYIYPDLIGMVEANIFRDLPPAILPLGVEYDPDEDDEVLEAGWPHLFLVYTVFNKFIDSNYFQLNICQQYINDRFCSQLLALFESDDPRERESLKLILHKIYAKFLSLRPFIRKQIAYIFYRFIYEKERHNGIDEILEVLCSIVHGFAMPLKEEHVKFLTISLMPLFKSKYLLTFAAKLNRCLVQYIQKDNELINTVVIPKLLAFWPRCKTSKEILFIKQFNELILIFPRRYFLPCTRKIFRKLAQCANTTVNFQVVETSLLLWDNREISELLTKENYYESFSIMFPALFRAKRHWHQKISDRVLTVLAVFREFDREQFDRITSEYKEVRIRERQLEQQHIRQWYIIEQEAKKNPLYSSLVNINDADSAGCKKPPSIFPQVREVINEDNDDANDDDANDNDANNNDANNKDTNDKDTNDKDTNDNDANDKDANNNGKDAEVQKIPLTVQPKKPSGPSSLIRRKSVHTATDRRENALIASSSVSNETGRPSYSADSQDTTPILENPVPQTYLDAVKVWSKSPVKRETNLPSSDSITVPAIPPTQEKPAPQKYLDAVKAWSKSPVKRATNLPSYDSTASPATQPTSPTNEQPGATSSTNERLDVKNNWFNYKKNKKKTSSKDSPSSNPKKSSK